MLLVRSNTAVCQFSKVEKMMVWEVSLLLSVIKNEGSTNLPKWVGELLISLAERGRYREGEDGV